MGYIKREREEGESQREESARAAFASAPSLAHSSTQVYVTWILELDPSPPECATL